MTIPFNYFYLLCRQKYLERLKNVNCKEFQKTIQMSIWDTCLDYLTLSNSKIEVIPKNTFEFIKLILDNLEENPYQQSFLTSLQFICVDYLEILGVGSPILMLSENETPKEFMIYFDNQNKKVQFQMNALDELQITRTIVSICMMEETKSIGPLPYVRYRQKSDV